MVALKDEVLVVMKVVQMAKWKVLELDGSMVAQTVGD